MKKAKTFAILLLLFISILILGSMTFFYNVYTKNIILQKNCDIFDEQTSALATQLKESIDNESLMFEGLSESKESLMTNPRFSNYTIEDYDIKIFKKEFQSFLQDNPFYIGKESEIRESSLDNSVKIYYKVTSLDKVYLFSRNFTYSLDAQSSYYFLVTNDMSVVIGNQTIDSIRYLFSGVASDYIDTNYQTLTYNNEKCYAFFKEVTDLPNPIKSYYFVYIVKASTINEATGSLAMVSIFYSLISILIVLALLVGLYFYIDGKNNEIQTARQSFRTSKKYIFIIHYDGKIKSRNLASRLELKKGAEIKNICELPTDDIDLLRDIKNEQTFRFKAESKEQGIITLNVSVLLHRGGYYLVMEDITKQEVIENHIKSLAWYNPVTHLPNVNALTEDLEDILAHTLIGDVSTGLVLFDITNFRSMNKVFGRTTTDAILIRFVEKILPSIPQEYKLYHMEADNFAILITNSKAIIQDEQDLMRRLMDNLKQPMKMGSNILILHLKAGIYNVDLLEGVSAETAIKNADIALKSAKASRNVDFITYDVKVGQLISQELLMEKDLRQAINRQEFIMYYQPQYSLSQKKIIAFEALIRWNNPKYIHESPEGWIKVAEQNNMIIEIGEIQLRLTLAKVKQLEALNIHVSVNISPVQLLQDGFVDHFVNLVKEYQVNPQSVAIEITETFLMESFDEVVEKIKLLKKFGFKIHLDDFGTGYSSMLYLQQLPVDVIKIDKEFTRDVVNDRYSRSIVVQIIRLAQSLDLGIITEGVETEKQAQFLQKNGCDIIQGYWISRPVDEVSADKLIKKYNG